MSVGVAILDTGIDFTHDDLYFNIAPDHTGPPDSTDSTAFSAFGSSCQDDNGHGTHVAGTVAALDNKLDVIGVAPDATLYCVKVLDSTGSGSDSTVMSGLDWVWKNYDQVTPPIKVVNMSLGRPGWLDDNESLRDLVILLYNAGVAVVVAAGNDPFSEVSEYVPATYPEVIAVASTTAEGGSNRCRRVNFNVEADTASYFTTDGAFNEDTGIGVTVSAPGERLENINKGCRLTSQGILSTQLGGGTTRKSGTSMAAPHVAGIVARLVELLVEQGVSDDVENIRGILRDSADNWNDLLPKDSPSGAYSYDGEKEGIAQVP